MNQGLLDRYFEALKAHLSGPSETGLNRAFEIGREAVSEDLGVLDMAMLHHQALESVVRQNGWDGGDARMNKAVEFFAESLSPFEMLLRGYRESNARLTEANEALSQAKAAVEAANSELQAFSYSVAHDLRAPLRTIDGFSQALQEDCAGSMGEESQLHLEYIRESARHMTQLIEGLLVLSRVTTQDLRIELVDLSRLAESVIGELRRLHPGCRVEAIVMPEVAAEGDARLLRVTLDNLIGNAWKYSAGQDPARIEFGVMDGGEGPVYFVRDNGAGFDMGYSEKLFRVFQRLHSTSEFEGTGIGLATVHRVIQRHGGRIWAEGKVGEGATFYFTLGAR